MNGNFSVAGTSQAASANNFVTEGPLQSTTSGMINAKMLMTAPNSSCFSPGTILLTGTVNGQRQLALSNSSQPLNGQVVQIMGTVTADGQTISSGTYTIMGGCLGGEHGTVSGFMFQPVTGTYVGSFSAGGATINITAALTQTSTVSIVNPAFELNGPISFSAPNACGLVSGFASSSPGEGIDSRVTGPFVVFDIGTFVPVMFEFDGSASDANTTTISGTFGIGTGPCAGRGGPLTLTRQ
jgi:hypothetical protein